MNVIGIVQTDLNEFNILFDQEQGQEQQQNQHQGQSGMQNNTQNNNQQHQQNDGNDDSSFFNFLDDGSSDNQQPQGNQDQNGQNQSGPQEMTVRIKGIPEGEKATFLQIYQIIKDAQASQELENKLTIVSRGGDQDQDGQQGQQQGQQDLYQQN